jgi:hypothetical protein
MSSQIISGTVSFPDTVNFPASVSFSSAAQLSVTAANNQIKLCPSAGNQFTLTATAPGQATAITLPDPGAAASTLLVPSSFTIGVATALTAGQSGSLINVNTAAGYQITLPAVALGLRYHFVCGTQGGNAVTIRPAANNKMGGTIVTITGAAAPALVHATAQNTVSMTATALVGDWLDIYCDGTLYWVSGAGGAAASFSLP